MATPSDSEAVLPSIPVGSYVKSDGGLSFDVTDGSPQQLSFRGKTQPMLPVGSGPSFRITWEWGTPTFSLRGDGTLVENGEHLWLRNGRTLEQPRLASTEQLIHFRSAGYLPLHGAVGQSAASAALQSPSVQQALQKAITGDGSDLWQSFGSKDPEVLALAAAVWPTVEKMLGSAVPLPSHAQVAIKLPGDAPQPPGMIPPNAHIDGLHTPFNGIPAGEVRNFTLLVGVALTPTTTPNVGNFGVFPGSHFALSRAVKRIGLDAALQTLSSSTNGSDCVRKLVDLSKLAPPMPLLVDAGSAYLAHYQTIHYVQPNVNGDGPRVAVYFRVTRPGREGEARTYPAALADPMLEMPGLRGLEE